MIYIIQTTTVLADKMFEQTTILEENSLVVITGFEDTTTLEDKKGADRFFR